MEINNDKYRHEYKYICTEEQLTLIQSRISNLLKLDSHVKKDNKYNIRSLYFDDYKNTCYYENEEGVDPREKFRIRIYNNDDTRITLELKKKNKGKTLKKSELITKDIVQKFIDNTIQLKKEYGVILKKLYLLNKQRLMRPIIIVDYERTPYVYKDGNVRITIDRNISSSKDIRNFFKKEISKRPINSIKEHILEVKFDEFIPDHIYRSLQLDNLEQTAFSKYYLCRKYSL